MGTKQQQPEELGESTAKELLHVLLGGGCVDTANQAFMLLYMTLTSEDVSTIKTGKLSHYTIEYLRNVKEFFGVTFKISSNTEEGSVTLTCQGVGFKNLAKRTF